MTSICAGFRIVIGLIVVKPSGCTVPPLSISLLPSTSTETCLFVVAADDLQAKVYRIKTHLVFSGLDTYTGIEICRQHSANTDNQFRQYVFDVSTAMSSCKSTEPELIIYLGATTNISAAIANQASQEMWQGGVDEVYEFPNRQFLRKGQSDFGW